MPVVYVPVCELGLATHEAAVRDARTRKVLRIGRPPLLLVRATVCVEAESFGVEDGLHRVRLATGHALWARVVRP